MNSGKVGVIRSPKFRKTGLAARLLSGCFSPSALNTRQDGQFLRWGHQVLCSSTQVQDAYDPDSRPQAENRFMGVHCWGNTETEGCGGGQEAQNPPVFMSILMLDQDYCCQDQVETIVDWQIKEAQRLCHELSLSVSLHAQGN